MTTGDKIAQMRKENNLTQEQLADLLGVSRQSVSKYESNLAYPETEKIIKLSEIFHCSTDYLLRDDIEIKSEEGMYEKTSISADMLWKAIISFDKKSERIIAGKPLWHIGKNAKGIIAIGLNATGVVSIGCLSKGVLSLGFLSLGIFSFGLLSLGLFSFGLLAVGLVAAGCFALGFLALGSIACGIVAMGAVAIGEFAAGALAIGNYMAIGDRAQAMYAFGLSVAEGSIFQHLENEGALDKELLLLQMYETVPKIYHWIVKWLLEIV